MKMKNMICKRVAAGVLAFAVGSMALAGCSGAEQGDSGKNTAATMQKSEIGQKESGQDDKPSQTNVEQTEAKELEDKNAQNVERSFGNNYGNLCEISVKMFHLLWRRTRRFLQMHLKSWDMKWDILT